MRSFFSASHKIKLNNQATCIKATSILATKPKLPINFSPISRMSSTHTSGDAEKVIDFWFGLDKKEWWRPAPTTDETIKDRFGFLMSKARDRELDSWTATAESSLALVILLDQFPRNCFRGSSESFSTDSHACEIATLAVAHGFDRQVSPLQAPFFYLPMEHSENLLAQIAAVSLYEGLIARCTAHYHDEVPLAELGFEMAKNHLEVFMRYGRFPGRNKALGRTSTQEEVKFLEEYPSGIILPKPKI